ncbi:hypothetical protein JX265_005865 [Neoarthrinium moseri]|uniref:NmrA-like domain-containing protein n=1 Tax=Neoarthrinium moseri TaxID=1658444 RepID=A0A9P9WNF9_9PEZI|nr:hypothetical protein JX265_005865 [Neoarthrinium moseri]
MVRIAVAGGSGPVSREVIDALMSSGKHDITILSRSAQKSDIAPEITWQVVDYNDKPNLIRALRGIHTLLSFVQILSDPDQESQKNLIDAAIISGVKRFAPSEYGSKGTVDMHWWHGKEKVRRYLEEVNGNERVLEYTLFQPGLFLDYLAFPYKTAKYLDPLQSIFDFQNCRAIVMEGHEGAIITLTTVADLAAVIARAVDYDGRWPTTGGIRGNRVTFSQILEIGRSFVVDQVKLEDLEAGKLKASWGLEAIHPAVPVDQASELLKAVSIGILLSSSKGAWDSSDEMNQLFPDHDFTRIDDFLEKAWEGMP